MPSWISHPDKRSGKSSGKYTNTFTAITPELKIPAVYLVLFARRSRLQFCVIFHAYTRRFEYVIFGRFDDKVSREKPAYHDFNSFNPL